MLNENHLIKDNIKNFRLLTESVDQKSIKDAIETNNIVQIYYQGDNTSNRGFRTIEPYALGDSAGEESTKVLLRAYQQAGATDTPHRKYKKGGALAERGGWRLFDVAGISSWMPVTGKGSKFAVDRDDFRLNDKQMSNIIAQHSDDEIPTDDTRGQGSIEQPNFNSTQGSAFDSENNKFQYDKNITHLFGKEKFSGKRNPANFTVIRDKNGNLYNKQNGVLRRELEKGTVDSKDIVGNLDELFKEISGLQDTNKIAKPAFEKFQNDLNSSSSLLGGERKKPIDKSFFDKQKTEFERDLEKSLQNT